MDSFLLRLLIGIEERKKKKKVVNRGNVGMKKKGTMKNEESGVGLFTTG